MELNPAHSLISNQADMQRAFRKLPTVEAGFYCPFCFTVVQKSTGQSIGIEYFVLWCDCYSRAYKEREKADSVTLEVWTQYISNSTNYQFAQELNRQGGVAKVQIINRIEGNYDIWCPGCGRPRKLHGKGLWMARKNNRFICAYGVCQGCLRKCAQLGHEEATSFIDATVDRLIAHYPQLEGEH